MSGARAAGDGARGVGRDTLILAWGNPGRLDDGLGPALAEAVAELGQEGVSAESEYQLQIEKAEEISRYDRVVFVDADSRGSGPFSLRRLEPEAGPVRFTTHSVAPASILTLSRDLFDALPEAWLLGIRGYEFNGFGERLSAGARANLDLAVDYLCEAIEKDTFEEVHGPEIFLDRLEVTEEMHS